MARSQEAERVRVLRPAALHRRPQVPVARKPLPKKRKAPRRYKTPRCDVRGCRKPQEVRWAEIEHGAIANATGALVYGFGMCRSHAKAEADRRFSLFIRQRDGKCLRCGKTEGLQCAHICSRRYLSVRWFEWNARALCLGCHKWETEQPLAAEDWWAGVAWGPFGSDEFYPRERLRAMALHGEPEDLAVVLARLGAYK